MKVEGRFRKKPVVIEAIRCSSVLARYHGNERNRLPNWIVEAHEKEKIHLYEDYAIISTLEGQMMSHGEDWIIRGVRGELYSCKGDIFKETYEAVE